LIIANLFAAPFAKYGTIKSQASANGKRSTQAARVLSICEFADVALRHYDFEKAGRNITYLCQRQSSSGS
jgi:hypothetical protein